MAIRNDTILAGLNEERTRIVDALNVDTKKLQADLAAIERAIAIYQPRVTESAKIKLPKVLKAAAKIRGNESGNEHGNGHQPKPKLSVKARTRMLQTALLQRLAETPLSKDDLVTLMKEMTGNPTGRGLGMYQRQEWITSNKRGIYSITPGGKRKLAELTKSADAPNDESDAGD